MKRGEGKKIGSFFLFDFSIFRFILTPSQKKTRKGKDVSSIFPSALAYLDERVIPPSNIPVLSGDYIKKSPFLCLLREKGGNRELSPQPRGTFCGLEKNNCHPIYPCHLLFDVPKVMYVHSCGFPQIYSEFLDFSKAPLTLSPRIFFINFLAQT